MKKFIFVISFVVFSSFLFGFTAQGAKAVTLSELQAQITRLHAQIAELQKLLYQIQPTGSPEEQIQKTETPGDFAPGRLLVRFKDNVPESKQVEILKAQGLTVKGEIKQLKVKVISVPEKAEQRLAQALSNNPNIDYAEPDYLVETLLTPNDTYFPSQWGLPKIQAREAWDITTGSNNINIAILDTGVDPNHPDLSAKIVNSRNFTDSPTVDDVHGHGTHVAGIAAAITNNGMGVAGMGYDSSILNVKVLGDSGSGYYSWVANGITWAADNGAQVINLSLGGTSGSQLLEDAVNYAWSKGVVVVAAAGNSDTSSPFYPAYYANCMAVAATDRYDNKASWSNYGSWVDVAAPGVSIYATLRNGVYGHKSGTSMASPFVAGLAGLLFAVATDKNDNGFINDEIRLIIEGTTDPIDWGSYSIANGRINAYLAAMTAIDDIRDIYSLTVSSPVGGLIIAPKEEATFYYGGSLVQLQTVADPGYKFIRWTGDTDNIADTENYRTTIIVEDNYSIIAEFEQTPECTIYNGYTYCRGFRSTDPQGSSCEAACSARGYACPVGDNMFRSFSGIREVATVLGLLHLGQTPSMGTGESYYSPFVITSLSIDSKSIHYDSGWNQICTHAPLTDNFYSRVKICRCEGEALTYDMTVNSSPVTGISITSATGHSGTTNYTKTNIASGASISLTAPATHNTPTATYDFASWSGTGCSSTNTTVNISMTSDTTCTANYKERAVTYSLSVNSSPVTGISVTSATGHSGTTNYAKTNIASGASISLTAPATHNNYQFTSWTGCDSVGGTANRTCTLTLNSNKTVAANYTLTTHTLSVTKTGTGTGAGTVTSNPAGISCGATCSASYNQGTSVTLTATADANSTFVGWSGACTGTACTVDMTSNKSVTATFNAINIIDCVKEYGQEYWCTDYQGWEMECRGKGDVKNLPQETFCKDGQGDIYDKCVTCWEPEEFSLSINSSPVTGIYITANPYDYSNTTNYTKTSISSGTSITLSAPSVHVVPGTNINYDFASWSGTGCSSSNNTISFSITSNMSCTASYKENILAYTLSVSKTGTGAGTVTSNPAGISCGATCSASYGQGTSVTLTVTADTNSTFASWSGACTGTGTCTLTMDSNKSVTATFDKKSAIPEGCTIHNGYIYCRGFRSTDPQGSSCNAACSARGYTCPTGDNMFRSISQIAQVATTLGFLSPGERYSQGTHRNYYSPYIRTTLSTGAKTIYYDSNWNQICTHAPSTAPNQQRVKICRCQEALPSQTLEYAEYQLASLNNIVSQLIDSLTSLIRR